MAAEEERAWAYTYERVITGVIFAEAAECESEATAKRLGKYPPFLAA